jgi:hypothetical protein
MAYPRTRAKNEQPTLEIIPDNKVPGNFTHVDIHDENSK